MTLEARISAALARRGSQRLGQFLANALGLTCRSHHAGAVCGFHLSDEEAVKRLETYADELATPRESTRAAITTHALREMPQ